MVFRLIINITYSCVVYYTFTASVLLGHSYLPPLDLLESACHLPSLLWSCQRVPVSLLAPCHLSPAELCLPPTHATSVLLWCAYHLPSPPQSCFGVPTTYPRHLSPAVVCLPPTHAYSGPARECLSACWPLAISVLLSCAYHLPTPPQSCCGVPTTSPCLLWSCQRVPTTYYAYSGLPRECLPVLAGPTCWVQPASPATNTYPSTHLSLSTFSPVLRG